MQSETDGIVGRISSDYLGRFVDDLQLEPELGILGGVRQANFVSDVHYKRLTNHAGCTPNTSRGGLLRRVQNAGWTIIQRDI